MTVETTTSRKTIGAIVKQAFVAGALLHPAQNPIAADKAAARGFLDSIIKDLPNMGTGARALTFVYVQLTIGTYVYPFDPMYLGSVGRAAYIPAGTADLTKATGENTIEEMSSERWQSLSTKSSTSTRPTMFFLNRQNDALEAWLWPIPDEAGTVRFHMQRMLADCDDDNATLDLEPFWEDGIGWALSAYLQRAKGMAPTTWMATLTVAEKKLRRAAGRANEAVPTQASVGGNYGGRR